MTLLLCNKSGRKEQIEKKNEDKAAKSAWQFKQNYDVKRIIQRFYC